MNKWILAVIVAVLTVSSTRADVLSWQPHKSFNARADAFTCGGNAVTYAVVGRSVWAGVWFNFTLHAEFTTFEVAGPNFYSFDWGPPVPTGQIMPIGVNLEPGLYKGRLIVYSYDGAPPCVYGSRFVVH